MPSDSPPKTHAEVAKKLWKRLLDADVDACNPDCDDQTRGPVAILTTALRDEYERGLTIGYERGQGWAKTREGAMARAGLVFDGEDKIVTRHGTILDDDGNVRRVQGEFVLSEEGDVIADGARVYFPNENGSIVEWDVCGVGNHIPVGKFWTCYEAAAAAKEKLA